MVGTRGELGMTGVWQGRRACRTPWRVLHSSGSKFFYLREKSVRAEESGVVPTPHRRGDVMSPHPDCRRLPASLSAGLRRALLRFVSQPAGREETGAHRPARSGPRCRCRRFRRARPLRIGRQLRAGLRESCTARGGGVCDVVRRRGERARPESRHRTQASGDAAGQHGRGGRARTSVGRPARARVARTAVGHRQAGAERTDALPTSFRMAARSWVNASSYMARACWYPLDSTERPCDARSRSSLSRWRAWLASRITSWGAMSDTCSRA